MPNRSFSAKEGSSQIASLRIEDEEAPPETHSTTDEEEELRSSFQSNGTTTETALKHISALHEADDSAEAFANRESRAVSWLRLVVLAVLVTCAACTAVAVYYYTRNSEYQAFEASFVSDAAKVMEAVGATLYVSLGAVDSYVVGMVSLARATNQSWPFVTVPDAAVRFAKLRSLSKAVVVQQAHFVTLAQRPEWENYTLTHDQWAADALKVQKTDKNYHGRLYDSYLPDGTIHSYRGPSEGEGPFLPTWQSSPVVPVFSTYNWDALGYTSVSDALSELLGPKRVVISKVSNMADEDNPISVAETKAATDYIKDFIQEGDDPSEPFSVINFPIIDVSADYVSLFDDETGEPNGNHTVVGLFTMMFFWRDLIRGILPVKSEGIICVFDNTCNQTFTYEILGPNARYLGRSDLHDPRYDYMGISQTLTDFADYSANGRQFTGLPLGGELCPYTLRVYPSATLEDEHTTNNPEIFTVSAILIFVFTSAVFLIYDICVEKRQRKVMNTAVQSTASVSLLERMVKERTRKLEETNSRLEEANRRVTRASAVQLEHFACMSHEIRTPLNCIIGLSSLLLDTELSPMQEESTRMIVSSGDLLLTVVNDVLDYSKLESGNVEIKVVRSNLQDTLNAVVQSIETKARPNKLSIRTVYDPCISEFALMDCRRLQQILYNLLGNAVKFSDAGGTIDLSVSLLLGSDAADAKVVARGHAYTANKSDEAIRSESLEIYEHSDASGGVTDSKSVKRKSSSVKPTSLQNSRSSLRSMNPNDDMSNTDTMMIRFAVKDRGKGIARRDFATIFQPFRQASAETERVYGGTGLGLAVTAKLATSLGGSISVDSIEGQWSEFTVDLPYRNSPVDIAQLSLKLKDTTIILVDDDTTNVHDVSQVFRQCHLDFNCFKSMAEMVSWVERSGFLKPSRSYICLAHERLYDEASYQVLARAASAVLLTHGPKYAVKEAKGHYRSLTQVLPSVLMESMLSFLTAPQQAGTATLRSSGHFTVANALENLRIMIAEDNKVNQKVLVRILKRLGCENVDVVDDGKRACDQELQQAYDVILMDIQMPVMNGIEACRTILSRTTDHPKPKIVFVTAHVSDACETECRAAGGVDFLPKPFNVSDIESCLQRNAQPHPFNSNEFVKAEEGDSVVSERVDL